jgi:hypothetical protein
MKKAALVVVLLALPASFSVAAPAFDPCALLDDERIWAVMSSAMERTLLDACDGVHIEAVTDVAPDLEWPQDIPNGDDVPVSDPAQDAADASTQSECTIAVRDSDGWLMAGWNDSTHYYVGTNSSFIGYASSADGGATWADAGGMSSPGFAAPRGDPSVGVDSNGTFWFTTMVEISGYTLGLGIFRSADAVTFGDPVIAHNGPADDKVLLAIDRTGGPHDGNLYVCAVDFNVFNFNVFCVRSIDGGNTFSAKKNVCPECPTGTYQAPYPAVAPNGDVYVAWTEFYIAPNEKSQIEISRSTDGGQTFAKLPDPMPPFAAARNEQATAACGRPALTGNIRYLDFPSLAIGPDGAIHLLYSKHGDGDDDANVVYVKSTDEGQTWSPPKRVNDDTTNDQFMQTIAVSPTGVLFAYWYDRRDAASNRNYKVYYARSLDGGETWTPNQPVSDVASPPYNGPETATCYMGDYNQAVADAEFAYVIWSDNRRQFNGHPDPDVYFEAVPLCDNAAAVVLFDPPAGEFAASDAPLEVALTLDGDDPFCVDEGSLHYTTDGSAPTVDSPTYSGPLAIDEDTVVRVLPISCCGGQALDEQSAEYTFGGDDDNDASPDDDDDTAGDDDDDNDDDSGCGC